MMSGTAFDVVVDVHRDRAIDEAGATAAMVARTLASGWLAKTPPPRTVDMRVDDGAGTIMELVFDAGILSAGAVAGSTPDHLLGLAGYGSAWPKRDDPRLTAYCGRMETMTGAFCKRVRSP